MPIAEALFNGFEWGARHCIGTPMSLHPITVAALYRFARFADPAALRGPLQALCDAVGIKGTLLLAREGVNGTIAGSEQAITQVIGHIRQLPDCAELDVKYSHRSEEHTSELQSLMRISYAVFCLKKKKNTM